MGLKYLLLRFLLEPLFCGRYITDFVNMPQACRKKKNVVYWSISSYIIMSVYCITFSYLYLLILINPLPKLLFKNLPLWWLFDLLKIFLVFSLLCTYRSINTLFERYEFLSLRFFTFIIMFSLYLA